MLMDIALIIMVVLCARHYWRKGFALTVISLLQWFLCIVLGLLATGMVRDVIRDDTAVGESMRGFFSEKFTEGIENSPITKSIPAIFDSWIKPAEEYVSDSAAEGVTNMILAVLAFIVIVLAVKLFCSLLTRIFSKKYAGGVRKFLDGLLGAGLGLLAGACVSLLFLAALVPLMTVLPEGVSSFITDSFKNSYFSGDLYDGNYLLKLLRDIFS